MSQSTLNSDSLSSVAQQVHAGNRLMARMELDPQMSVIGDRASSWLWQAWLADSPGVARSALQRAQKLDPNNKVVAAGITFVQGLLDWQPIDIETDFDVDPEFLIDPVDNHSAVRVKADLDIETDFEVDPELIIDPDDDAQVAGDASELILNAASRAHARENTEPVDIVKSQQPVAAQASSFDANEPRPLILVVDDSPTVRSLVSFTLNSAGYQVMTVTDGVEALHMISNRRPALVLTDAVMPKLDGYKLCKLIKNHEDTRDVPVMLMSENEGVVDKLRRSMAGCRDYVVKPFESKVLIEKVRQRALTGRGSAQPVDAKE